MVVVEGREVMMGWRKSEEAVAMSERGAWIFQRRRPVTTTGFNSQGSPAKSCPKSCQLVVLNDVAGGSDKHSPAVVMVEGVTGRARISEEVVVMSVTVRGGERSGWCLAMSWSGSKCRWSQWESQKTS